MTDTGHDTDDTDALDFPGADRVQAAATVAPPTDAALDGALAAVRAAIAEASPDEEQRTEDDLVVSLARAPRRPGSSQHRLRRRVLVAVAAAAAVVAGAAVYPELGPGVKSPAAPAGASDFLRQVADTVGARPSVAAPYWQVLSRGPAQVVGGHGKTRIEDSGFWLGRHTFLRKVDGGPAEPFIRQVGKRPQGSKGSVVVTMLFTDAHGQALGGVLAGPPRAPHPGAPVPKPSIQPDPGTGTYETSWRLGGVQVTWDQLKTLPTQEKPLRKRMIGNYTGARANQQVLYSAITLLVDSPADSRLRAAVYRVLADTPHLHLTEHVKDSTGRTGTAVELDTATEKTVLVVDPSTGALLETRASAKGAAGKLGMASWYATYLSARPTSRVPHVVPDPAVQQSS